MKKGFILLSSLIVLLFVSQLITYLVERKILHHYHTFYYEKALLRIKKEHSLIQSFWQQLPVYDKEKQENPIQVFQFMVDYDPPYCFEIVVDLEKRHIKSYNYCVKENVKNGVSQ